MKVLKFGGTSVGSTEAVKNLRLIVEREKENDKPLFVVCSAFSGITNSLLEATEEAVHNRDYQSILDGIEQRHYDMIKETLPVSVQNPLLMLVKGNFNILEDLLSSVAHLGELSNRTKAKIVSLGEQLSCPIIAAYLNTSMPAEVKAVKDSATAKPTAEAKK